MSVYRRTVTKMGYNHKQLNYFAALTLDSMKWNMTDTTEVYDTILDAEFTFETFRNEVSEQALDQLIGGK